MARTADEIMDHHMQAMGVTNGVKGSSQGQDIDNIMSDYADDLVAIVNMGGKTQIMRGRADLQAMVSQITGAEPNPDFDANFEVIFRQSAGNHVVLAFTARPAVSFAVFCYTVKDGKATHVSGYQRHPSIPIQPSGAALTAHEKGVLAVVEHHIAASKTRDADYILQDYADDVVAIFNEADAPIVGKAALAAFCRAMYGKEPEPGENNADNVKFVIKEVAGDMVLLVFEDAAGQGFGSETYVVKNGKIVFVAAVFQWAK